MRYAIIADVHSNLAAFTAVLDDIERWGGMEELWCLGDVVGYGPDPHECIALLRQHKHVCVAGNHDLAATGKLSTSEFNADAAATCQWTARQLTAEDVAYLNSLRLVAQRGDFTLVHGSPREPVWEYLISVGSARENFAYFQTQFCLVGHSHVPLVFRSSEDGSCSFSQFTPDVELVLGTDRLIINPGGVGQPRDGDSRASYAIYDDESRTVRLYRVSYDIKVTQSRMVKHNLPARLVTRLNYGM
jgi:diadenosine tetraphosphatase ApaH/serine/threonine PP2A family protein phosphatase